MTVQPALAPVFDPLDPDFQLDPYPVYQRLRDAGPVLRLDATQWVAARYEPVAALLRDPRLRSEWPEPFQRMRIGDGAAKEFLLRVLLHREGEDHARLRRLLSACMQNLAGDALRRCVTDLVDARLDRALAIGSLEVMADLALPVPAAVACEMLGIPAADRPLVQEWGIQVIKAFTVILPEQERPAVDAAIEQMRAYLDDLLRTPGRAGPVAALLADPQRGGPDARAELVDNVIFLLVSGFTTTVHVLAAVGAALLLHPDVAGELRADPALVPGAVDEFLRHDAPIQHISRNVLQPVVVGGRTIRPGRIVHLLLGAANTDERQFTDPGRLDIRRNPNPHVAFGAGLHACLGAGLGKLEAVVTLRRLLDRCGVYEPAGDAIRRPVQVFRTYERIPVRVAP
jgi:cytochrome P450